MQVVRKSFRLYNLNKPRFLRPLLYFKPTNLPSDPQLIETRSLPNCSFSRLCSLKSAPTELDALRFEKVCDETLESLTEYFEKIVEDSENLKLGDVSYSSGVLTVNLGPQYGTYVINRQTPNRQIWLSSPTSGPKRYDFIVDQNCWIYKHDGQSLHKLLQTEISKIVNIDVDFSKCVYSKLQ